MSHQPQQRYSPAPRVVVRAYYSVPFNSTVLSLLCSHGRTQLCAVLSRSRWPHDDDGDGEDDDYYFCDRLQGLNGTRVDTAASSNVLQERQQHRSRVAPVPPPGPVLRFVPGQRLRRPGNMQTGRWSWPGRHWCVQPVAPQSAAAIGSNVARGGCCQCLLHARRVCSHTGGMQVCGCQRVLSQPWPFFGQQYAGVAASSLWRVRRRQGRISQDTQTSVEIVA